MIKRFLTNLIYRAFGWGALFFCLFLGFASGAVIGVAAIAHFYRSLEGDASEYRSSVSYSDDSHIVTRADMARCSLIENRSPDPDLPEDRDLRQPVGYSDETLLACSDELDRAAYDIARKNIAPDATNQEIHSAAVKKKR